MKTGYIYVFWSALAIAVVAAAMVLTVVTGLILFRGTPVLFTASLVAAFAGSGMLLRDRSVIPLLRKIKLQGKLLLAPVMLLLLSVPAAIIYIYYDLNGTETLNLLSSLFTSLASLLFLASLMFVTLPSLGAVYQLFMERDGRYVKGRRVVSGTIIAIVILFLILVMVKKLLAADMHGMVLMLPLMALLLTILDIILSVDFRNVIAESKALQQTAAPKDGIMDAVDTRTDGFRNVLHFAEHYVDYVCEKLDFLNNVADDNYAAEVINYADKTLNPGLLPALKAVEANIRFSVKTRQDAGNVVRNIEKYYSNPGRHTDMLRLTGISEKSMVARSILLSLRKPGESEILKLLSDTNPDIKRTAIIAAGKFGISELREEIIKALHSPETESVAFHVLRLFGPEVYGGVIGTAFRPANSERENLMIVKLLSLMPLSGALPYLNNMITGGQVHVRLIAAEYLCEQGFNPEGTRRQKIQEIINETVQAVAKLISLKLEAVRSRHFILAAALEYEKVMNTSFLYALLALTEGQATATMLQSHAGDGTGVGAETAAEIIDQLFEGPYSKPLKALLGNQSDSSKLTELSLYYPLREVTGRSLVSSVLSTEQNITGIWTKACALHKVAVEGKGLERELALSYLFSNSKLLQQESARAIRAIDIEWFSEAESRLPEQAREGIAAVINGNIPEMAMIFEKTRFLSLCFKSIPEERIIMLASAMRYSDAYDADSLPGLVSWMVPSHEGRSGLYTLPVSDIARFVFHYSEYTDIFVEYMNTHGSGTL
jgi:hypothetical protein